ncbi:hypothetical protein ACIBK9_50120 [Nonomuraea sp. NPDC050227]|uniref:hypothetical protein n=1 Tax=Nonomuraea sp. NPDC050227 TaxID=3364360 RepID=UPI00379C9C43
MADLPSFVQVAAATTSFTTTRFFLNMRLAVRIAVCVMAVTSTRISLPAALSACLVCMVYDLTLYGCMRRGSPLPPWLRLALDAVDVALWSAAMCDAVDAPALIASPLAFERALFRGVRALVVPMVVGVATNAILLATGQPYSISPLLWPAFTVAVGLGLARYLELRIHRHLHQALADREAAHGQAELAGRHSVAVGADTVIDLLTRTWPLLAVPGKPVGSPLTAWRQQLAEQTTGHADYLSAALLRWEQRHNLASPDLSRDVRFRTEGGCASLLLSHRQVAMLETALVRLAVRDLVVVTVPDPRPLAQRQELQIGSTLVILPEDAQARIPSLDPGPSMIALGAVGSLTHSWPTMDGVPLPAGLFLMLTGLAVAWWCHRQIVIDGDAAHGRVLAAALAFGAVDALVATALMANLVAGGLTRLPFLHFPLFVGPLAVMYVRDLTRLQRATTAAGFAAIFMASYALLPLSLHPADAAALLWPLAFTLGASGMRDLLDLETAAFDEMIAAEREGAVRAGYRGGRQAVLELVRQEQEEAERRLSEDRALLDPFLLPEAESRLAVVRARLAALSQ